MRLILIRHAKSSWNDPGVRDHDRVLNDRGRRSATAIGAWLKERGYVPDQILSSDSARTTETVQRLSAEWDATPDITYLPELYHASEAALLRALHGATGKTVAIVAHNPGIAGFAEDLLAEVSEHPDFWRYPTCATLVADFDADSWGDVRPGTGRVVDFIIPRELTDPA